MAVTPPGWWAPYWQRQQNGDRLQFVSNSRFAGADKTPRCDLVEVNKIGQNHLAEGGKKVLCHKLFTFESPYRRKIRRFKTVLVLYLVQ